ncbi:MAG: hypothetical protein HGA61_04505 [Candidatus Moranbacteria bacterium]|nr:hypothetical protein [Candidatus Moranbacteria bacterium]
MSLNTPKVEVILDEKHGQVMLRMIEVSNWAGQDADYLRHQVENLSYVKGLHTLLPNGYELVYDGGKLLSESYHITTKEGVFVCLIFSDKIRVNGSIIHFKGEDLPKEGT